MRVYMHASNCIAQCIVVLGRVELRMVQFAVLHDPSDTAKFASAAMLQSRAYYMHVIIQHSI